MMNNKEVIKGMVILFIVITGSVLTIRSCTNGETLADYANKNSIPVHAENVSDNIETIESEE